MAAFQSKTGWKRLRKRENKNYRSDPMRNRKFQKKFKKLKKNHHGFILGPKMLEKAEKEKI